MISKNASIIKPFKMGIIENQRSYWATHFYSILQCLDSHKNLMHSPRKLSSFPLWNLGQLRGHLPPDFFAKIESYMSNWGIQYFLNCFLNQKLSGNIVSKLIENLEDIYDVKFNSEYNTYSFHISGNDSALSATLKSKFTEVFPKKINNEVPKVGDLIAYSDLCLILTKPDNDAKIAVFGEVEGIYGNKLRNESYWKKKQNFCVFGIGVVSGNERVCYFENKELNGVNRVNIYFENSHPIVKDFSITLSYFKMLFNYGPSMPLSSGNEEFDFFLNKVKLSWEKDIPELLTELSMYIDGNDAVGFNSEGLSIITDLQSK